MIEKYQDLAALTAPEFWNQTAVAAVAANPRLGDKTKLQYQRVISDFIRQGCDFTNPDDISRFMLSQSRPRQKYFKSVLNYVSERLINHVKARSAPENQTRVRPMIDNLEAMRDSGFDLKDSEDTIAHNWLKPVEIRELKSLPNRTTLIGRRDFILLGTLLHTGARRDEVVKLTFEHIVRQGERFVIQIFGKGRKNRIVPISDTWHAELMRWRDEVGEGAIIRSVAKGGRLGGAMNSGNILPIVAGYGKRLGLDTLAPHDLRRTYAQIGYDNGVEITQLSLLLGHSSVKITEKYLNIQIDLQVTVSDHIAKLF
jgi:integrase